MAPTLTLLGLPLGVFRLIVDLLDRDDINTFRLVSRACRHLCEHIIFRKIVLQDLSTSAEEINENICDRLCDPKDSLSYNVRHLQIGPFKQDVHCPAEKVLVKVLNSLQDLRDFSWNVRFAIPEAVLSAFHRKWPDARVHVTNLDRDRSGVYIPLDTKLLSSPQLHSLDFTVQGAWVSTHYQCFEYRSEFHLLKMCLLRAKRLKHLRLNTVETNVSDEAWKPSGQLGFDFEDGDVFPTLEELTLPYKKYGLPKEHCERWAAVMDWSQLRRLDLGHGCPKALFEVLTGRIPQLKALSFGFWLRTESSSWDVPDNDLEYARRFLGSIEGLEEVNIDTYYATEFLGVFPQILEKHGRSLKKFHLSHCSAQAVGLLPQEVDKLVTCCPILEEVSLKIFRDVEVVNEYRRTGWPESTVAKLLGLRKLRNLRLEVQLDEHSYGLIVASGGNMFLIEEEAEKHTVDLFRQLTECSPVPSIQSVTVKFLVVSPVNEWSFTVKKGFGDGKGIVVGREAEAVGRGSGPVGTSYDPFG